MNLANTVGLGGPTQNHAVVCIEDLKVSNLSRSAAGTRAAPGKNVNAKSGLNRAILDQGWGEFRRQLGYKLDCAGGDLITVPAQYTSQQCSSCGHIARENRQSQAHFCCVSCSHTQNADTNAANNIVAAGHAVMALVRHSRGEDVRPDAHASAHQAAPVKQEPAGPLRPKRFRQQPERRRNPLPSGRGGFQQLPSKGAAAFVSGIDSGRLERCCRSLLSTNTSV